MGVCFNRLFFVLLFFFNRVHHFSAVDLVLTALFVLQGMCFRDDEDHRGYDDSWGAVVFFLKDLIHHQT